MTSNTPFPSISELSRMSSVELDAVVKRADVALRSLHQRDDGTARNLSPSEQGEFDVLMELRSTAEAHARVRTVFDRGRGMERSFDNFNVNKGVVAFDGSDALRMGTQEVRDRALAALERREPVTAGLSSSQLDKVDMLIRSDDDNLSGDIVARRILVTENPAYKSAWKQVMTSPHPLLTTEETEALRTFREFERNYERAQSSTSAAGGYGIPVMIDPSIILTNQESDNPFLRICRVEPVTTNVWKGVSAAGMSWSFDTEASEVSDDAITVAQPTVTVFTARGFLPYSIEIGEDYPNFATEMARILAMGYDDLLLEKLTNGNGSTEPDGIITKLDATSACEVLLTTAGSYGAVDLYRLWAALPQKYRRRASFMGSVGVNNTARQFANAQNIGNFTVDLSAYAAETIFGKPYYENDHFSTFSSTTGHQNLQICGDFQSYVIAQRTGMSVELVPMLFGLTNNRPTGQRGWFSYARVGGDVVNTAAFVIQNQT